MGVISVGASLGVHATNANVTDTSLPCTSTTSLRRSSASYTTTTTSTTVSNNRKKPSRKRLANTGSIAMTKKA
ncbi:unnamed protein product [Peronospora belbahrii]|uniref:Uncharacterized protein n=1 Tax=Peronospora belbahrii TaxID=622444 RepID=A0ABN8D020_9STRA|nr:unnamed protein product [Peronospora belbahrii]